MSSLHMMVGNVGSGKSELAAHLVKKLKGVIVNMDAIQESMHGFYGGYNRELKPVYRATEDAIIIGALEQGVPVIIDRTNMNKKTRARFINIAKKYTDSIHAYVLPVHEGPFASLIDNRMKKPRGLTRDKWTAIIQRLSRSYESPTEEEGITDIYKSTGSISHRFMAFDFDGTIVSNKFPEIGDPNESVIEYMQRFWHDSIWHRIIIWTCRSGNYAAQAAEFLREQEIPYDFINENPIVDYGGRKVFANAYVNDRCVGINRDVDNIETLMQI